MGLQRDVHIAGAKSTVASLWKVDDAATEAMMTEFYRQLWKHRLGKAAAIRQTQLAMLENYDLSTNSLQTRGLTLLPNNEDRSISDRLPPYYWAAFGLSGQWR